MQLITSNAHLSIEWDNLGALGMKFTITDVDSGERAEWQSQDAQSKQDAQPLFERHRAEIEMVMNVLDDVGIAAPRQERFAVSHKNQGQGGPDVPGKPSRKVAPEAMNRPRATSSCSGQWFTSSTHYATRKAHACRAATDDVNAVCFNSYPVGQYYCPWCCQTNPCDCSCIVGDYGCMCADDGQACTQQDGSGIIGGGGGGGGIIGGGGDGRCLEGTFVTAEGCGACGGFIEGDFCMIVL
jgi:hypothetical protein